MNEKKTAEVSTHLVLRDVPRARDDIKIHIPKWVYELASHLPEQYVVSWEQLWKPGNVTVWSPTMVGDHPFPVRKPWEGGNFQLSFVVEEKREGKFFVLCQNPSQKGMKDYYAKHDSSRSESGPFSGEEDLTIEEVAEFIRGETKEIVSDFLKVL